MPTESAIDSILVKYAGIKSAEEIADETGLDPEDVVRRTQAIFDRVKLTVENQLAKNIHQLSQIVNSQLDNIKGAKDEDVARLGNTAAASISRLSKEVEALRVLQERNTTDRDEVYARSFATAIDRALQRSIGQLKSRYPELEESVLGELLQVNLIEIALEMDNSE